MRAASPRRLIALVAVLFVASASARADEPRIDVHLVAPERLTPGDRAAIIAEVTVTPRSGSPLLLTPTNEGASVEVVRGRLVRADAVDPEASPLRFEIPVVAKSAGTSILRVRILTYVCEARCRAIEATGQIVLEVTRGATEK